ncbi:hypothetical protein BGLA2_460024 [Burkholderia gladioli]|nr:hypothetical protein BGLA2_460024 [Burkholderia gladioli]
MLLSPPPCDADAGIAGSIRPPRCRNRARDATPREGRRSAPPATRLSARREPDNGGRRDYPPAPSSLPRTGETVYDRPELFAKTGRVARGECIDRRTSRVEPRYCRGLGRPFSRRRRPWHSASPGSRRTR